MSEVLLLATLLGPITGGGPPTDPASLIDPADYFASRRVEVNAAHLLELASARPTDARGGLQQLLAVRWLGENKDRLGEYQEAVRKALGRLAEGADELARDQARIALARIDGKPIPALHTAPKDSLRDGLAWFPEDVTLAGVLDTRAPPGQRAAVEPDAERPLRRVQSLALKALPDEPREEVYQFAEAVGYWRLDRVAVGFAPGPEGRGRVFVRGTGRIDHKRLAAYLREKLGRDVASVEKKGLRGEPITILAGPESPPAFVLVGDSDLVLAGYMTDQVSCTKLAEEVLSVRAGGRPSVLTGPVGKSLRDLPAGARGLVRGELPREWVAALARSPIGVSPQRVAVDLLAPAAPGAGLDVRLRGTLDDEADARQFAEGVRKEIRQVAEALKALPLPLQLLGVTTLRKTVEEIEVGTDGPLATARVKLSPAALKALLGMLEMAMSSGPGRMPNGG